MITVWFITSLVILIIFAIMNNTSAVGLQHIQFQFDRLNCPSPIATGQDQLLLNGTLAFGMNVTHNLTNGTDYGTFYKCEFDPLSGPNGATTFYAFYENYQDTTLWGTVPIGWFAYLQDWLTNTTDKIIAFFTLIAFFLTPINFNIVGYSIDDISGIGLMLVIAIYGFAYIGIGAFFGAYIVALVRLVI